MSLHQKIAIDTTLLTRYLAGEATPDEAMAIDDWLKDDSHIQEFESMQQSWQLIYGGVAYEAPNENQEWAALEAALPGEKKYGSLKRLVIRYAVAALIAGVLLGAGLYTYLQYSTPVWQDAVVAAAGNIRKGVLPDGSGIVVNRNGTLQYARDYNKDDRKVLLKGEGYFDVVADKDHPFVVHSGALKIQVLGTSFNVKEDTGRTTVAVTTGKVKLYTTDHELIVAAGQTGTYLQQTDELLLSDTIDANSISYATGDFSFQDMPLPDICRHLENTFGVKIILDNAQLSQCRMSAHFKDRPFTYIMDILSATLDISYTTSNNIIHISGNGCN
ncbi:FecR family protein [Chitinophaga pinensis]|uniref:Anti-FecI sigma factor, FecR n=1 Tax=Chitinophaga pinensis (strain ATCC 43595 / DSM 2588 / LMG 13176 / NBRC 15968 / NCIMB 11800 / UQM 2034) TaxID=485918 RepID=A0A979H194_CHIPD|nr:FecR domain-containing protein [Chitinophaga pinensis]ACU64160.1 anti-FecI sigma factor, FecR [Chitinophaga pinensis DSM 2588]